MGCREIVSLNFQLALVGEADAIDWILYDEFTGELSWILACQQDAMRMLVK